MTPEDLVGRERPLTPGEVGDLFGVDPKTATRWAVIGRLPAFRTPAGHWRFTADGVRELLGPVLP